MTGQDSDDGTPPPAYSYRADDGVPVFPDGKALVVFDGVCVFCSAFARFILRHDRHDRLNLCTAQSPLGRALFLHYRLDPDELETNIVIRDGRPCFKSDAFIEVMRILGGRWAPLAWLRFFPRTARNRVYDRVARIRYRLFGKTESCVILPPEYHAKILDRL